MSHKEYTAKHKWEDSKCGPYIKECILCGARVYIQFDKRKSPVYEVKNNLSLRKPPCIKQ